MRWKKKKKKKKRYFPGKRASGTETLSPQARPVGLNGWNSSVEGAKHILFTRPQTEGGVGMEEVEEDGEGGGGGGREEG